MSSNQSLRLVLAVLGVVLGVALGVAAVIAGGYDDSPGLQGIGAILVVGAVVVGWRVARS